MKSTLAQLDAAEERLLNEWRAVTWHHWNNRKWASRNDCLHTLRDSWAAKRNVLAVAIRAIRAQRNALDGARLKVWHVVEYDGTVDGNLWSIHATRVGAEKVASSIDGASVHCYTVDP